MENPNTTWLLSSDVVNALQQNISTISSQGDLEKLWLNETQDLSNNWLNGSPNGPVYTVNADGSEETLVTNDDGSVGTNPVYDAYNTGPATWTNQADDFDGWVDTYTMP